MLKQNALVTEQLVPLYSVYLMFIISAIDRLIIIFSDYCGRNAATSETVFILYIPLDWFSPLKKTTRGKMI